MKPKLWDILIIITALFVALGGFLLLPKATGAPQKAVIEHNGQRQEFVLPVNEEIEIEGVIIKIEGFEAFVLSSDCPDKTCVKTGVLTMAGQKSVCLPNGVILSLEGNGPTVIIGG